jgi:SAM-dependent methyltransferase
MCPNLLHYLEFCSMYWKTRCHTSSRLNGAYRHLVESADAARIRRVRRQTRGAYREDPSGEAKYTRWRWWLLLNLQRAVNLQLHSGQALRIMDIGCGPGYFMAVARALGHECHSVDVPEEFLTPVGRTVYPEVLSSLHCTPYVSRLLIERFVPLPFERQQYDLITAFLICFNRHMEPDEWGSEEWRFFVEDACRCLRRGGRLFLELNENPGRYGELCFYDLPTLAYLRSVGTVDGKHVTITRS